MKITVFSLWLALILTAAPALADAELTVYAASEPEMVQMYTREFKKSHPDITLNWVRDSAGPILARLLAEKDNPRADVVFGLSLAATLKLKPHDLLAPYRPKGYDELIPGLRDNSAAPVWTPLNAWGAALCVNRAELAKLGLPAPAAWADLTRPAYAGRLVMPSPVSSSTGLFIINGWFAAMGQTETWEFMTKLDANLKMYVHSGAKPCQMAAQGEAVIGLSSGSFAGPLLKRGAPLDIIVPEEGVGWDMEVAALVNKPRPANDPALAAAQKLMDFAASPTVARLAAENGYVPARAEALTPEAAREQAKFLPLDFDQSAEEREAILNEWRRRFEQR